MARKRNIALPVAVAFLTVVAGALAPTATAKPTAPTDYLVLFKGTAADAGARAAITKAGGTITKQNTKVGYAYVRTTNAAFADTVRASGAVAGAAKERVIGSAPQERRARADEIEKFTAERAAAKGEQGLSVRSDKAAAATTPEPLADLQWDMRMIGATSAGSYAKNPGKKGVRVGIIDTGIDGSHPDIKPNFNAALSRNFVVDMPDIDGPCEVATCVDPNNVDDDGHGTHVASTIGSPINGLGVAGVAPNVTLINIRAGQDSGYFFLRATLDALTYAGDIGVDVVNMSYYTDPWLFNCLDNPADSPAEQLEQRTVRQATQRALNYARNHGVLPVAAMGNEATDLNAPTADDSSPDYPANAAKDRNIDNSCITVPTESNGRRRRERHRAERAQGVLLELRHGADRHRRAGRRRLRHANQHPEHRRSLPGRVPGGVGPGQRAAEPGRHAEHPVGGPQLPGHRLRLLPVPAGHLDGLTARRGGRRPGRQPARSGGPQERWAEARPERNGVLAVSLGPAAALPATAAVPLHPDPAAALDHHRPGRPPL